MERSSNARKFSNRRSTIYASKLKEIQLAHLSSKNLDIDSDDSLDSEKSYETLFNKSEVYEAIAYLIFNFFWLFISGLASVILFVVFTYNIMFDPTIYDVPEITAVLIICNGIIVVDTCAAIIHTTWKKYASYRDLNPRFMFLIVMDCASIVWMFTSFFPMLRKLTIITTITLVFMVFRLYRAIWFFYVVSEKPGFNTVGVLLRKYGFVLFLFTHICACVLQGISKKTENVNWTGIATEIYYFNKTVPVQWYIIAMHFSLNTICFQGVGDLYARNDAERIFLSIQMIISFFLITGTFLGAWTTVQVDGYTRHSNFMNRINLIKKVLHHKSVTNKLKHLLISHYQMFWNELKAVQDSDLFKKLPEGLRLRLYFDHYWNAFEETYLLKGLHPAFLREVASTMSTEIYAKDELMYLQGVAKNSMIFVQRGALEILSGEDEESRILSLGVGTCLGETNLIYSFESPVTVKASTYTVVQRLFKKDLWRIAYKYRRLQQTKEIHTRMKNKFDGALSNYRSKETTTNFNLDPSLKRVKNLLREETDQVQSDNFAYNLSVFATTLKDSDEVFLKTTFPWIFDPASTFLKLWEYVVCIAALLAAVWYPHRFSFERRFSPRSQTIRASVDCIFMLDLLFQAFTAVETKTGIVTSVTDILSERKTHILFIMDILSVLPLHVFSYCVNMDVERLSSVLMMNRLLKLYRVIKLLSKYGVTLTSHFTLIRCMKYVVYLLLISYFMGSLFYLLACFHKECLENSWFIQMKLDNIESGSIRYKHAFETSFLFGTSVLTQQGTSGIMPHNILELIVAMIFYWIALLIFCYLVADYSATVMLAETSRENFVELAYVVRNYLRSNDISASIQYRTDNYLTLQWSYNKGYNLIEGRSVLYDAPQHLFDAFQSCMWYEFLQTVPLFHEVDFASIQTIVSSKEMLLLPPNDVIVYSGNIVKHMYIIENGFCEIISAVSGKVEKILGPLSSFCVFDMLLDRPGIYTIRTLTHVRVLKFSCEIVKTALGKTDKKLEELIDEVKRLPTVQRLFRTIDVKNYEIVKENTPSWFIFSKRRTSIGYQEYENGFKEMKFWAFLKPILLRRTIIPNGDFIVIWELAQSIRIFTMCIAANIIPIVRIYFPSAIIVNIVLDVFTVFDMYVRMHLCYYNKKGILITHPRYTAHNYFTTSFAVDILTLLPFPSIYNLMVARHLKPNEFQPYNVQLLLSLHKLLQIYRIPGAFYYFERDSLRPTVVTLNVTKVCLLTIILLNALTVIMVILTCDVKKNFNDELNITPNKYSWLTYADDLFRYNVTEPLHLYLTDLYFTLNSVLLMQFGDCTPQVPYEVYFNILLNIAGYLLFTYILVVVISCRVNVSGSLTTYQQHMQHLISYMKKENISKELQNKTINYYEYIWERRHGLDTSDILNNYHFALKQDLILDLYKETFKAVPVFSNAGRSFYSTLGMQIVEEYYLENFTIIYLNDIVNTFYIIHRGTATVIGPDGSVFVTLTPGCVFGHIDNTPSSRSMVSVVSSTKLDLLCIGTKEIYSIIKDYPLIGKRLERHILLENLSYIDNNGALARLQKIPVQEVQPKISKKLIVAITTNPLLNMITSSLSCIIVPYHLAFCPNSYYMLWVTYIIDLLHGIFLYNRYFSTASTANFNSKRSAKFLNLKTEIFALLPFDVFAFCASKSSILYYLTWCRLNRMFRMWNIFNYYNVVLARINIQVSLTSLSEVCIYLFLTLHVGACILYLTACPGKVCKKDSWAYDKDGNLLCDNEYICSFYFIINIVTGAACGDLKPNNVLEVIIYMGIALLGKFIMAVLIANISAIIQNYSKHLSAFDYDLATLKQYLENNSITPPLINQTIVYVYQLWDRDQGLQVPVLLSKAPSSLIKELKMEAYGQHIYDSFLFGSCHMDLLRLIISKLQVQTYFRGDIICHQGAVNYNMYFIHKGVVSTYESDGFEKSLIQQLHEFDCFGMLQGLLCAVPHTYTYTAESVCVILTLHLLDWIEFLRFYRAARHEIYSRIYRL